MFLQFFAEENACHVSWINFYAMFVRSFWTILISSQFILEIMFKKLENHFLSLKNLSLIFYFSIFSSLIWNFNNQWKYYKVIWNRGFDYSFLERCIKGAVRKNDVIGVALDMVTLIGLLMEGIALLSELWWNSEHFRLTR